MAAHPVDSSFRLPHLMPASARSHAIPDPQPDRRIADNGLGALRGLAFALLFEALLAIAVFSGWHLWHIVR